MWPKAVILLSSSLLANTNKYMLYFHNILIHTMLKRKSLHTKIIVVITFLPAHDVVDFYHIIGF